MLTVEKLKYFGADTKAGIEPCMKRRTQGLLIGTRRNLYIDVEKIEMRRVCVYNGHNKFLP